MKDKEIRHVNLKDAEYSFQTEAMGVEGDVLFLDDVSRYDNPLQPRRL